MKTVKINLYPFAELDNNAKDHAIENYRILTLSENWYDSIYDDAKEVGIEITGFDLDYNGSIKINLLFPPEYVADKILASHGEKCDTYNNADSFMYVYKKFQEKYRTVPGGSFKDDIDEGSMENDYEEITEVLRNNLARDYFKMLKDEYEYLTSDNYITEQIEANDYLFFKSGKMANCTTYVGGHEKAGTTELKLHGETYILE